MKQRIRTLAIVASTTAGLWSFAGSAGAQAPYGPSQGPVTGPQPMPGMASPPGATPGAYPGGGYPGANPGANAPQPGANAPNPQESCAGAQLELSQLVGQALGGLELRQDQQSAVQPIVAQMEQAEAPVEQAQADMLQSIADALQAGTADRSALTPKVSAFVQARLHEVPTLEQALSKLHDVLDPQQRSQFVDALEGGIQQAVTPPSGSSQQTGGNLALTQDQIQKLQALGAGPQQGGASPLGGGSQQGAASEQPRILQVLDAFKGDTFNPEVIAPPQGAAVDAQQRTTNILGIVDGLNQILTPEQRTSLAQTLRSQAQCLAMPPEQGGGPTGAPPRGPAGPPMGGPTGAPLGTPAGAQGAGTEAPTGSVTQEQRGGGGRGGGGGGERGGGIGGGMRGGGEGVGFGRGPGEGGGRGFGPGVGERGRGFGEGSGDRGRGFGEGFGDRGRGFGEGFGDRGRGFGDRFGRGFGDRFGRGFGDRFGRGFGRGFYPGYGFPGYGVGFPGYGVGFPGYGVGYPVVVQYFTPFTFFTPFANFATYYSSSVDISVVIQAMTSSFAFF